MDAMTVTPGITNSMHIAMAIFRNHLKGDTIEERFQSLLSPAVISEANFMGLTEDQQFRSAVGAVMLSYGQGTPEFERIEKEMLGIQKISAYIQALQAGVRALPPELEKDEDFPIGLLNLWRHRERR